MVGLGGEQLHPVAQIIRMNESVEIAFERRLIRRNRSWSPKCYAYAKQDSRRE